MAEEQCSVHRISWSDTFPFVRLFSTFKRAVSFSPLMLAFSCVLLCYVSGRVLDAIWKAADRGVRTDPDARLPDEIFAYAALDTQEFDRWISRVTTRWNALQAAEPEPDLADRDRQVSEMLDLIDERIEKGLARIEGDEDLAANEKAEQREGLLRSADMLRLTLAGYDPLVIGQPYDQAMAVETILGTDPDIEVQQRADEQGRLTSLLARQRRDAGIETLRPRGPFISLLKYEMHCFAAAIHGVCSGRWGLSGSALSDEPAMISSIASAGSGALWLVTQRLGYAVVFALVLLVLFAFFGGAICRVAAVRSAREESTSFFAALRFSREKLAGLIAAPLLPVGIFAVAGILIFVGGLIAAIPYLETIIGLGYVLALLGGVVLVFTFLAVVLGFHLMWPTIAVEASDAFDAVQRAAGYVFQRAWHVALYSFALLLYGGVSFVIVRIIGMLLLKLTHTVSGAGMNLAGNSHTSTIGKLDALWHMPAWQDLPLLPAVGNLNFWGEFDRAPLSGTESFAMILIALWVFMVVGLVGAFVVSFYFCGSTEMYLLLRREVDAVDYDEIYYEEPGDDLDRDDVGEVDQSDTPDEQPGGEAADQPSADPPSSD